MMTNCDKMVVVVVVLSLIMLIQSSAAATHKDVASSGNSQPAIGLEGEVIVSLLPSFTWIDSSSIRVILPNGVEDIIQLWPAEKLGDMLVPCLFEGKLKEDDMSVVAVSGCQHDDSVRIDIYANFLQGYAATFNIKNGITEEIGRGNIGKINNAIENQERKTRRKRGGSPVAEVPPFLLYDVKFGYEESLLAKLGSHEAAQEYIMRVFTLAKVTMQHPSLGTKIRLRAQLPIQFVPNKYWSGADHTSLQKALTEAQTVKQEEAVPVMFFVGSGTLSTTYTRKGCDPRKGLGIQPHQDDLEVAIVSYLHDVGHWMGLRHDEDEDSRHGTQCAGTGLMSEQVEPEKRPKIWSSCSQSTFPKWFHRYGSCLKIDSVQLTGGSRPGEGNVYALNSENQLGPVCDDSWEDADARVVCRQLGYAGGVATKQSQFGRVNSDFAMDDVNCNGDEARIQDCNYNIRDNCGGGEGAGVICTKLNVSATDGGWSVWSEYGLCSVTCGDGQQTRTRSCDNPAPAHGGRTCTDQNIGNATETKHCNLGSCAIDGGWSVWSEFGSCSVPCGGGIQTRTRSCDNPSPARGGRNCTELNIGDAMDTKECNRGSCDCPSLNREWFGVYQLDLAGGFRVANWEACGARCSNNRACDVWKFHDGWCWNLAEKNLNAYLNVHEGYVSGWSGCPYTECFSPNTEWSGDYAQLEGDDGESYEESWVACGTKCTKYRPCDLWKFDPSNGLCFNYMERGIAHTTVGDHITGRSGCPNMGYLH